METELGRKYAAVAAAHELAADAHSNAAKAFATVQDGDVKFLVERGKLAVELSKEAARLSSKASETERLQVDKVDDLTITVAKEAALCLKMTSGDEIGRNHDALSSMHLKLQRQYLILEAEEDVRFHMGKESDFIARANAHNNAAAKTTKRIEALRKVDEPPLMDTPEFEAFAAAVGNYDYCGCAADDRFCDYVEPELSELTLYLAKRVGLEIPAIDDDSREEERAAIFSLVEAAYISYLYQSANPS